MRAKVRERGSGAPGFGGHRPSPRLFGQIGAWSREQSIARAKSTVTASPRLNPKRSRVTAP